MATTLIVSPHLDDAVLSIGGFDRGRGRPPVAACVIASDVHGRTSARRRSRPRMRKFADYETRRAEDAAACKTLGAEVRWLGQIERAFRPPYLTGWSFFRTPPDRSGFTGARRGHACARAARSSWPPIGSSCRSGLATTSITSRRSIAATDWALAHRLERPALVLRGLLRARRRRCAADTPSRASGCGAACASPLLHARAARRDPARDRGARSRGPSVDTFLAPALRDARWHADDLRRARATRSASSPRSRVIRSQTRAFGGLAGIARAIARATHAWWGRAEPLWRAEHAGA